MIKTRVIPCLLLKDKGLVKTIKFKDPKYLGDPINAVRIFNDKEVSELIFLDITASREKRGINFDLIHNIASECFMPLCYGGGIRSIEDIKKIFTIGVEKVSINSCAIENKEFIHAAAKIFGSQSIVTGIDVKKDFLKRYKVYNSATQKITKLDPIDTAKEYESLGTGEILLNSVDQDGTMTSYDIDLIKKVSDSVSVPVIACGGASNISDFGRAVHDGGASAVAAGSLFVFQGKYRAVLINYPSQTELKEILE